MDDPTKYECHPTELPGKLEKYIDGNAQLWNYTASHCMATFRIYKNGINESFLTIADTVKIEADTMWKITTPNVSADNNGFFILTDGENSLTFKNCLFSPEEFRIA